MEFSLYAKLQNSPQRRGGEVSNSWRQYSDANISCFTENDYHIVMNERLWSQLPEDLVDMIIAWLPVASFLRLRTVCKKWNTIMYSHNFLEVCSQVPTPGLYSIKISSYKDQLLSRYNPALNKWHDREIPVNCLPPDAGILVASAGGLLCFIKSHGYAQDLFSLFVCNPFTKSWKELPSMPRKLRPTLVCMVAERRPFRYKVIVAGVLTTEVFYSIAGAWRRVGSPPRGEDVSRNIAFFNGNLYCLNLLYNVLLSYNLQQEMWVKVRTGRLPGYCQYRNLVGCKGCILIVGKSVRHRIPSVCVWSLDQKTMKWKEIGRMSQPMSEQFILWPSEGSSCIAHEDLIFVTNHDCDKDIGVVFNLSQKSWTWVSGCPHLVMAFEPRLDAVV